jgi:hypothetical protein
MSNGKWEIEGNIIEGAADGKWHHQVNVAADKSTYRCVRCQHMEQVELCSRCNGPWFTGTYHNGELALLCMSCQLPKEAWTCPQCGTRNPVRHAFGKLKSGPCFIATAAFEGVQVPEVIFLRRFRDNTLSGYKVGRGFISVYQRMSPPLARIISRSQLLKRVSRSLLRTIIKALQK